MTDPHHCPGTDLRASVMRPGITSQFLLGASRVIAWPLNVPWIRSSESAAAPDQRFCRFGIIPPTSASIQEFPA